MSAGQRRRFGALVLLWLAAGLSFLLWWFRPEHVVKVAGMALNTGVLLWVVFVQSGWYLFFVARMRRPNPACPLPEGPVAIVVTKAPSEPWPVVRRTLEGMLRQDFPRPYDVWLADEDPDDETRRWCAAHGVRLSCRKGIAGYHNRKWPRRARCKEGNLAYFYDRYGYEGYAFVAQLDADHVPEPGYLREIIRPFADPGVGYVAAPSICDANAGQSWAARARLYAEAALHGPLQAGYTAGMAPLCIGSHYAVRTRALRQVGGLGPELAEDHSTTLLLSAAGWRGGFALDAIAHGDGPATLADFLTQEFQWSRSLVNVLLTVTPRCWSRLPLRLKLHFAYCQLWYVGLAASMLLGYALPVAALVTGVPWANVDLLAFYVHSGILLLATLTVGEWVRRQGWGRPHDAPLVSWEVVLGNLLRWPWVALGIGYAVVDSVLRQAFAFKVTPKGVAGARPLYAAVLAPYLLLAAVEAGAALLVRDAGRAGGYYFLTVLYSATYVAAAGAAAVLHAREQGTRLAAPAFEPAARLVARPLALALLAGAVTVAAGTARWEQGTGAIVAPALRAHGDVLAALAQDGQVLAGGVAGGVLPRAGR
jgi:cellulose synthase/poly-beta-1,6-N-acetylglucosamine synthase-like glycosyltransferase